MSKHTKGPWKHDETWGLVMSGETEIAACHSGIKANANLISAAPDLLETCEQVLSFLKGDDLETLALRTLLETTIAKAKGES